MNNIKLYNGNCLEVMDELIANGVKVDAIITDPPYGTTKCKWDSLIPFNEMWSRVKKLRKERTPTILFGSEPFSSMLRCSNIKEFKYDWYLKKSRSSGFLNVKKMPLKNVETISVFYNKLPLYNPQGVIAYGKEIKNCSGKINNSKHISGQNGGGMKSKSYIQEFTNYPTQVLEFSSVSKTVHPTQKSVELMEYLIKTYTNEGDTVLDFTMGSGTTGVACVNTGRKFIGIELDEKYFDIGNKRIQEVANERD